jgi:hypothetical protein
MASQNISSRLPLLLLVSALGVPSPLAAQATTLPPGAATSFEAGTALQPRIVNGVETVGWPTVGFFLSSGGVCSGTMIGCSTFLTAAHCVCDPPLTGAQCASLPPGGIVFLQHAGFFGVSSVKVHPGFAFGDDADLAVLKLAGPVTGVAPTRINTTARPAVGTQGLIVGFGVTHGAHRDTGIKRQGVVTTAPCVGVPAANHLCWTFNEPLGSPGSNSNTCPGDSGGPLFTQQGGELVVSGVTSGGISQTCMPIDHSFDADVFKDRSWIQSQGGSDLLNTACGAMPQAGGSGSQILGAAGDLSAMEPEQRFTFEVPAGTTRLRVALNAENPGANDFDLYLRRGVPPTATSHDCASELDVGLEFCELMAPQPGTWHILARHYTGAGRFQVTVTVLGGSPGNGPSPPYATWITSEALPDHRVQVRLTGGAGAVEGQGEAQCIAESICVSGALPGRPEIFFKVIGPRPNGYLWAQISRFTPSKVEIWAQRVSTGQINYYLLDAVAASDDNVSGLQDREAFLP